MEQSIVTWEDDKKVTNCPYCAQTFSRFSQPKHHCRLCGKVVCGDPRTACSKEISLDVAPAPTAAAPKGTTIGVRICAPCTTTLFSNRDFATSLLSDPPAYVRAYATLFSFQTGITEQLPRFQRLVDAIASSPGDRQGVVEGVRMKKRIVETLAKVDGVAKTIGDCMGDGAEERLRRNILAATGNWGRNVGLRVKAATAVLDDVIIRTRPTARDEVMARLGKPGVGRATTAVTKMVIEAEPVVEETEADRDEKTRDVVVVLEEQKFLVLGMMEEARKRRRFDEVEALGRSLDEIVAEVERLGGAVVGV